MQRPALPEDLLQLVLAVHAGALELAAIEDGELRQRVRESHEQLLATADADEHLPAWLIAVWPKIESNLHELERQSIETHLGQCAECREELELLLRLRLEGVQGEPTARTPSRSARGLFWTSSWAVVATAALLLIWLRGAPEAEPGVDGGSVTIAAALRGELPQSELAIAPGTTSVRLDLSQLYPTPLRREWLDAGASEMLLFVDSALIGRKSSDAFVREPDFRWEAPRGAELAPAVYECELWIRSGEQATVDARFTLRLVARSNG